LSARTDLENALSILDAGITAHVTALKNSHAVAAVAQSAANAAQAAANDESYLQSLTTKVIAFADTLAASNPVAVVAPVVTVAPEVPSVAPVVALTPAAQVAAQVAQVAPVSSVVPVGVSTAMAISPATVAHTSPVFRDPGATPAMIAAALAAETAMAPPKAPVVATQGMFAAIEASIHDLAAKAK
jgi:hypothetical protein